MKYSKQDMSKVRKTAPKKNPAKLASKPALLPLFLRPWKVPELVRLGRDNDGGYLVDKRSIISSEFMLGFGINDDWSFEKDFKKYVKIPILAFDASVGLDVFFKKLWVALARGSRKFLFHWPRVLLDYLIFFRGSNRHIKKFIGGDKSPDYISVKMISDTIIPATAKNVFFKIDIEGAEYEILDDLIAISDQICGLVIELHRVDIYMENIKSFVKRFPLKICHVHCNNNAEPNDSSTPMFIELTFTKFEVENAFAENLSHALDQPNNKGIPDYSIKFL